jgi:hypothetical protein
MHQFMPNLCAIGPKCAVEVLHVQAESVKIPLDTRQVVTLFSGLMLLEVKNISIVAVNKFGDGGIQPLAVWALHEKYGAAFQGSSPGGRPV